MPYQVSIKYVNQGMVIQNQRCSGSLIAVNRILTAAHCCFFKNTLMMPDIYQIYAGSVDLTSAPGQNGLQMIEITREEYLAEDLIMWNRGFRWSTSFRDGNGNLYICFDAMFVVSII